VCGGDGAGDLRDTGVLSEVATPGPQRSQDRVVVGVRGEDRDLDVGVSAADLSGGFDPVHAGHAQIHHHDAGRVSSTGAMAWSPSAATATSWASSPSASPE
jgi:hypothetical protein